MWSVAGHTRGQGRQLWKQSGQRGLGGDPAAPEGRERPWPWRDQHGLVRGPRCLHVLLGSSAAREVTNGTCYNDVKMLRRICVLAVGTGVRIPRAWKLARLAPLRP